MIWNKRKRSFGSDSQMSDCDTGPSPPVKKARPVQADRAQQIMTQLAPAGGLEAFKAKYEQGQELGSGGFASVYSGVRKSDGLKVAIKHAARKKLTFYPLARKAEVLNVPMEVYLMFRAAGGPDKLGQSAAVSLLDWFELDTDIIIVMERPSPSTDLVYYSALHYPLPEETVRDIMRQLVLAVIDLHNKRVFHRDLKSNNVLIQETEDGIRVRIIDFGCGCVVKTIPHTSHMGCVSYAPPELFLGKKYWDSPTSVWQIGGVAYELLNEDDRFFDTCDWVLGELSMKTSEAVSDEGKRFIQACLEENAPQRISLEELERHPWFLTSTHA